MTISRYPRFFWLLILCAVCLLFSACDSSTPATDDVPATSPIDGTVIYTLVRTDYDNDEVKAAAVRLKKELQAFYAQDITLTTDWVGRGEDVEANRFANEIIIGETNRAESEAVYASLNPGTRDMFDYVLSSNENHYLISATNGNLDDAVTQFLSHVKADPAMLFAPPTKELSDTKKHVFPLSDITVSGVSVAAYDAIVYPAAYDSYAVGEVSYLSDLIFMGCGTTLPLLKDTDPNLPAGNVIRIGARADDALFSAGRFSYSVTLSENGISVDGRDVWGDTRGLEHLTMKISAAIAAGGTLALSAEDGIRRETPVNERELMRTAWTITSEPIETEEQIAEIKDCGFNLVILEHTTDAQTHFNHCKWLAKYELQALWYDSNAAVPYPEDLGFTDDTAPDGATYIKIDSDGYLNTDVTWGHMLRDEPHARLFGTLEEASRAYEAIADDDKIAYINLFPIYASEEQLGNPSYQAHLTEYFDTVKPSYGSVDIYPLNTGMSINSDYFENLDLFATECRNRDLPFSVYIQSVSFASSKRTPNEREMRWQAWCCLAFGAENIEYFTYTTPDSSTEDFKDALIARSGEKTERWYGAQAVNRELAAVSDAFMQYKNLGAFNVNEGTGEADKYMTFQNQYTDFDAIESIAVSRDKPVLIGAFSSDTAEHSRAFVCVDLGDPGYKIDPIDVTVDLTSAKTATLYYRGETTVLTPDENGCITFTLEYGDGCFVT